jgi:hypothetical protein
VDNTSFFEGEEESINMQISVVGVLIYLMILLSLPFGVVRPAHAMGLDKTMSTRYYVDQKHSQANDGGPGSEREPWKTIQKAANTISDGDTVIVKAGTYTEEVDIFAPHAGTEGHLITFLANPGDSVVIDGGHIRSFGFRLGVSYIRVQGFEIMNVTGHGILIGWSDGASFGVEILNNRIHDCGSNTDCAAIYYSGGDRGFIGGNHLYNNSGDGITFNTKNMTIRNNLIHDNQVDGIKGGGPGVMIIEGNTVHNQSNTVNHGDGIQAMGMVDTVIIRNNVWWSNTQDIYLDTYSNPVETSPWGDVYIYNNIVYNPDWVDLANPGLYNGISIDNRWNTIHSIVIYENTIVDCNDGNGGGGANSTTNPAIGTLRVFNNLFYNSITNYSTASATNIFVDFNVYYNPVRMSSGGGWYMSGWVTLPVYQSTYPTLEQHSSYIHVSFANYIYPNPDFHLVPGSGAIDKGFTLSSMSGINFAVDYNGVIRPQGLGWDAGAYEFHTQNSVGSNPLRPETFQLFQNYPNPFNPSTLIGYQLSVDGKVRLSVYDMLGREIATLLNEEKSVGTYNAIFNAANLPSGVYFYRLSIQPMTRGQSEFFTETKRFVLLK